MQSGAPISFHSKPRKWHCDWPAELRDPEQSGGCRAGLQSYFGLLGIPTLQTKLGLKLVERQGMNETSGRCGMQAASP